MLAEHQNTLHFEVFGREANFHGVGSRDGITAGTLLIDCDNCEIVFFLLTALLYPQPPVSTSTEVRIDSCLLENVQETSVTVERFELSSGVRPRQSRGGSTTSLLRGAIDNYTSHPTVIRQLCMPSNPRRETYGSLRSKDGSEARLSIIANDLPDCSRLDNATDNRQPSGNNTVEQQPTEVQQAFPPFHLSPLPPPPTNKVIRNRRKMRRKFPRGLIIDEATTLSSAEMKYNMEHGEETMRSRGELLAEPSRRCQFKYLVSRDVNRLFSMPGRLEVMQCSALAEVGLSII
ncbi:unnamed protein product [Trichobilharzia regenti]|nr:unnamed protein product [Trichobilharzia regenti]